MVLARKKKRRNRKHTSSCRNVDGKVSARPATPHRETAAKGEKI